LFSGDASSFKKRGGCLSYRSSGWKLVARSDVLFNPDEIVTWTGKPGRAGLRLKQCLAIQKLIVLTQIGFAACNFWFREKLARAVGLAITVTGKVEFHSHP
jgi:hypothetical protein